MIATLIDRFADVIGFDWMRILYYTSIATSFSSWIWLLKHKGALAQTQLNFWSLLWAKARNQLIKIRPRASMLKNKQFVRTILNFNFKQPLTVVKFVQQAKQKQALLESILSGITCSTGMVKRLELKLQSLFFIDTFQESIPKKTQSQKGVIKTSFY